MLRPYSEWSTVKMGAVNWIEKGLNILPMDTASDLLRRQPETAQRSYSYLEC